MEIDNMQQFRFVSPATVRFAETDANRHMSHVSPILYMEQARCDYLFALGLFDSQRIGSVGMTFVLARQAIDYKAQAYFQERIDTYARVSRIGNSSLDIDYLLRNRDTGVVIAVGTSTLVYFDARAQKSAPLPDDFRERVERLEASFPPLSL
ncbi:acyl-CoA thioesterase [Tumebacillus lipolyticus]|uniref:Acyl-CoA thioesterase n=1 Tax=Tumebacillus lipolyticus TaxID=1280370 RepID=A0ABW5A1S2_9BACL